MSVEEVLQHSINILKETNVPIGLLDQIGEPIRQVISNLQLCVDAFEENKKKNEEPKAQEPKAEIVEEAEES